PTRGTSVARHSQRGRSRMKSSEHPKMARIVELARRTGNEVVDDKISTIAGSVAFFGVTAVFPALIAIVSIYGLISNPEDVVKQVNELGVALPDSVRTLLTDQLTAIAKTSGAGLTLSLVGSLVISLWSAS